MIVIVIVIVIGIEVLKIRLTIRFIWIAYCGYIFLGWKDYVYGGSNLYVTFKQLLEALNMYITRDKSLYNIMRKTAPAEFSFPVEVLKNSIPFNLADNIVAQICATLNSGKHIIFVGAPGTGKTTVAQSLCRAAYSLSLSLGKGIFTTATADWTSFDTVGGYMPDVEGSGRLIFSPGIITRAILDRQWLVLDEINRTDIDKVIGPFFSILSHQEVILPFKNSSGVNYAIRLGTAEPTETDFYVHPHWRLIGTMNDYDKLSLYKLSYALMRRFAIIRIPTPGPSELSGILQSEVPECNLGQGMSRLLEIITYRDIGPGVFLDMARYIVSRCPKPEAQTEDYTREAVEFYLLPQFQGLPRAVNKKIAEIICSALPEFYFDGDSMEFTYKCN